MYILCCKLVLLNTMAEFFKEENRFTLFPIKSPDVWSYYNKSISCFWRPEEIDFSNDKFDELNKDEQHFISHVLAFFAGSDGIVNENLAQKFYVEIENAEIRMFYGFQIMMENIHSHTYSLLIDTYMNRDKTRQDKLFNAINEFDAIREKANWCLCHINDDEPFAKRLLCFIICEGVFFSGAFCSIFWAKSKGYPLQGLYFANSLIARDEALHTEFGVLLYNKLPAEKRLKENEVYQLFRGAVDLEREFICEALPCKLLGMNDKLMYRYIQFVADRLLCQLGYSRLYNVNNPFAFMEMIGLEGKTNFFENRVSEYALSTKDNKNNIEFIGDF